VGLQSCDQTSRASPRFPWVGGCMVATRRADYHHGFLRCDCRVATRRAEHHRVSLGAAAWLRLDEPSTTAFLWVRLQSCDQTSRAPSRFPWVGGCRVSTRRADYRRIFLG
jgi:hypothetical protein